MRNHLLQTVRSLWRRGEAADRRIAGVIGDLEGMNRATEADFLAITGKLSSLVAAARAIAAETGEVTASLSGETGESVCAALESVLENTRQLNRGAAHTEWTEVRNAIAPIRRSLRGFERIGPLLHVVATLAQIETAHLGAAGTDLGHLAGEFRLAGEEIRTRVESILQGAATLEGRIAAALREAGELEQGSLQALPSLLEFARSGLAEFRARQQQGARTTAEMSGRSEKLAAAIGDIVASIQFHDITRQQVEHVVESLGQVQDRPGAAPAVLELQIAQLENAQAAFGGAVRRMDERLEAIAGEIRLMEAENGRLLGSSDRPEDSFCLRMEKCFQAIAETAGAFTILNQRTQSAILDLQETLGGFEESVGGIHRAELRLRWLAINAAISAAHTGVAGEPLEAIAAAIQRLLVECESASAAADGNIRDMARAIETASCGSAVAAGPADGQLSDQLQFKIAELRELDEQATAGSRRIESIVAALAADLTALRESLSSGQIFEATTGRACAVLRAVTREASGGRARERRLESFEGRYTMQAEREVHESIAGGDEADSATAPPVEPVSGDLGENVELF